jgi:hypothetical protein
MDVAMVIEVHVLSPFPQMIHQMEGLVKGLKPLFGVESITEDSDGDFEA